VKGREEEEEEEEEEERLEVDGGVPVVEIEAKFQRSERRKVHVKCRSWSMNSIWN
jgi:hypothetical protein